MSKLFGIVRGSLMWRSVFNEASTGIKLFRGMASKADISAAFPSLNAEAIIPTAHPKTGPNVRIFAPYTVFKGKAALAADLRLPTFSKLESGDYRVERSGVIMLTFWPAVGERKYNWEKRLLFALSATEVGSLISLGPKESCEFFHDPSMKSNNAGQVRKTLQIKAHDDGSGYFLSLGVVNNLLKTNDRLSVPITTAEFSVLRAACCFALPHLLGWDQFANQPPNFGSQSSSKPPLAVSSTEWDR